MGTRVCFDPFKRLGLPLDLAAQQIDLVGSRAAKRTMDQLRVVSLVLTQLFDNVRLFVVRRQTTRAHLAPALPFVRERKAVPAVLADVCAARLAAKALFRAFVATEWLVAARAKSGVVHSQSFFVSCSA